jgi:sugar (pentulose or hexulose) kinase
MTILAADIGTTAMKLGIYRAAGSDPALLEQAAIWQQDYEIHNYYNNGPSPAAP